MTPVVKPEWITEEHLKCKNPFCWYGTDSLRSNPIHEKESSMITTIYQAVEEREKLQNHITRSERGSKIYRGLVKKLVKVQQKIDNYDEGGQYGY